MDETSHISPLRRWLESILVWYILFMIAYLFARFVIQSDWRFVALLDNVTPYLFFPVVIGLLIALLLRARRLSGVYFLVTLVGVFQVGLPLMPLNFGTNTTDGTVIEVVSFNLLPDNMNLEEASGWIHSHSPDIVALQETVEDMSAFAELAELYEYSASLASVSNSRVYSRYPILEASNVAIDDRIIQRLVLDIEGSQLVFYNLHLYMPLNERDADWLVLRYDATRRDAQIVALLELIEAETLPVIIAGNFNMTEWSPIYGEIAAQLKDAYRETSYGIGATFPAGESANLSAAYPRLFRLDYVWYSDPVEATSAIVGRNSGSDHLPLVVELIIP